VPQSAAQPTSRRPGDRGFSLIEQIIAMTIVLGVLLGLLSTLGAVAHAMTISRQRTSAVSLAKQTIENIQGADWANVATGTGVTTADPLVTPGTPLKFSGEDLFFGGTTP
jgi:Tfp pilus assembly protein PilV